MRNVKITKTFHIPLHLACNNDDLRPVLSNIYFDTNGYMYATNSHILVKAKCSEFIKGNPDTLKFLKGKIIHRSIYEILYKNGNFIIEEDGFSVYKNDSKIKYHFNNQNYKYPDCESLIKSSFDKNNPLEYKGVKRIAINPNYLNNICKSMDVKNYPILEFTNQNKAIKVLNQHYTEDKLLGLIMPMYVPE